MTEKPFFIATVDTFMAAGDTQTYEFAWGAVPWGSISMDIEPLETTGTLRFSDDGYTTKSTDAGGVVVYPPMIAAPIAIDRQIPLPPGSGAGSWAFGSLEISDPDGTISSLLRAWSIDAQNVTIKRGVKTYEAFDGYRSMRRTSGWYIDVNGVLQEAAAETVRWDYSTGTRTLLDEAASTNRIANPRAVGGAAGTPGTTPTGWTITNGVSGITRSIVAIGTDDGIPYIDVRLNGTASATVTFQVTFVSATAVAASVGQAWTVSAYTRLQAGSLTGCTCNMNVLEAGGSSAPNTSQSFTPTTATLYTQRRSATRTLTISDTSHVRGRVLVTITNGAVADITLRIGAPQLEAGSAATSPILPPVATSAETSRDLERLYTARNIWTSPPLAELETIFTGVAGMWVSNDIGVSIPIRDISYWIERPIQASVYGGTGTYDGTAEMAGTPLPKVRGIVYNITPVLIDPTNLIYQYTDDAGTVVALYERGAEEITFQANTTDLYTGTTNPGEYRTDNSRGLFQLGSPPVGQITIDATGEFPTAGAVTNLASIARYLLAEDCSVPSGFIDTAAFASAASAYAYNGGVYVGPGTASIGREIIDQVARSFGAKLIVGRDGKAKPLVLRAASLTATPTASIGPHNADLVRAVSLPASLSPPPYRTRCAYQHNYTTQTDISELADATHREFIQQPDRFASVVSAEIQAAYRRPNDLPPFGGGLDDAADAATVAADIAALWSTHRRLYAVTVPIETGIALDLGQTILLTWPTAFLRLGQRGVIVQEQFRSQENITFMVLI